MYFSFARTLHVKFQFSTGRGGCNKHRQLLLYRLPGEKGDMGSSPGFKPTLTTVFSLDIDPLDEMLRKHRMIYRTHIDMDCTIFNSNSRQMLSPLASTVLGSRASISLTTTHHGNTCVVNHTKPDCRNDGRYKTCTHFNFLHFSLSTWGFSRTSWDAVFLLWV